jgi:hypothetical protein
MLKPSEREKLNDCLMLIQSARSILSGVEGDLVPTYRHLDDCIRDVDLALTRLLRS